MKRSSMQVFFSYTNMDRLCEHGPELIISGFIIKNGVKTPERCFPYPEGVRVMPHCIINLPAKVAFNKIKKQERYKQKKFLTAK